MKEKKLWESGLMKKCKLCGLPISKNLEELSKGGVLEEYKEGYCLDCYLIKEGFE